MGMLREQGLFYERLLTGKFCEYAEHSHMAKINNLEDLYETRPNYDTDNHSSIVTAGLVSDRICRLF